jgi:hypothetical protein
MAIREDAYVKVGPLNLAGPAIDRDNTVKENNDADALDLKGWMKTLREKESEMADSDVLFFETLRSKFSDNKN